VKAPGYGDRKKEMLEDIAIVIGADVISADAGRKIEDVDISMLGRANRIVATKDATVIVGGKGKKKEVEDRVAQLRTQVHNTDSKFDAEKLEERIAKLTGGVAVIRVGAATETEMKYLKDKIEDAVNATKAAIEEGIVPGGGAALLKVSEKLAKNKHGQGHDEFAIGYRILVEAFRAPLAQIVKNAGRDDAPVILRDVAKKGGNYGFDASSDDIEPRLVDMFEQGIIDPVKVTRSGVENAASAAAVLLTTEAAVADDPNEKEDAPPAMPGGMPGMM
jgi:chaperonin GroEL